MFTKFWALFALSVVVVLATPSASVFAEEAAEPCLIAGADAFVEQLTVLDREILLTRYADAVEGLRALQRDMTCMTEPPNASQLGRMYLNLGYALHRMGLPSEGESAYEVAVGIDPELAWNDSFAPSYGVAFYRTAKTVRSGPTIDVTVGAAGLEAQWFIDGRLQGPGDTEATVHPGWHFVQVSQEGRWVGDWYNLQGEVSLDLGGLMRRLDPEGYTPVEATVPVPATDIPGAAPQGSLPREAVDGPSNLWASSVTGVVVGGGLLGASLVTAKRANEAFETAAALQAAGASQTEIDAVYEDQYIPRVQQTNGLRVAGGAFVTAGIVLGVVAAKRSASGHARRETSQGAKVVFGPGSLGLTGAF